MGVPTCVRWRPRTAPRCRHPTSTLQGCSSARLPIAASSGRAQAAPRSARGHSTTVVRHDAFRKAVLLALATSLQRIAHLKQPPFCFAALADPVCPADFVEDTVRDYGSTPCMLLAAWCGTLRQRNGVGHALRRVEALGLLLEIDHQHESG